MKKMPQVAPGHCLLSQWCSVRKDWLDLPGEYHSLSHAEDAATERGIYRVLYVGDGRRIAMEPFGRIGGSD